VNKLEGFEIAENKTNLFTEAIFQQQCSNLHQTSLNFSHTSSTSFAFVPFYSRRPTGTVVDKLTNNLKVTSIGQGNSLVKPIIKVKQLLTTLCSILKYFEYVVIGVTDVNEQKLVASMISQQLLALSPSTSSSRITVKIFQVPLPALLPFYLLNWGQRFLMQQNYQLCQQQKHTDTRQDNLCDTMDNVVKENHKNNKNNIMNLKWKIPRTISGELLSVNRPVSVVYYSESDSILRPRNLKSMESLLQVY
jgi:hypothetical protein